jgi:hypothetical protein
MVYSLQKFHHYLFGSSFKFFTDHSMLKHLVNKLMLGGKILCWLFIFQELDFEVIVKLGKHNFGLDHMSHIETGEVSMSLNDELLDVQLFHIEVVPDKLVEIEKFLITR